MTKRANKPGYLRAVDRSKTTILETPPCPPLGAFATTERSRLDLSARRAREFWRP
mgnify:CR=1 FL=1